MFLRALSDGESWKSGGFSRFTYDTLGPRETIAHGKTILHLSSRPQRAAAQRRAEILWLLPRQAAGVAAVRRQPGAYSGACRAREGLGAHGTVTHDILVARMTGGLTAPTQIRCPVPFAVNYVMRPKFGSMNFRCRLSWRLFMRL